MDGDGNVLAKTDAVGATTTNTYDSMNRLTSVTYSDSTPSVSFTYDAGGERTSMNDGSGATNYTYTSNGQLASVTSPEGNFSYTYDADGNVLTRKLPDGSTATYTVNADGQATSLAADGHTTNFTYDSASRLTNAAGWNGVTETIGYQADSDISAIADATSAKSLASSTYKYDGAGNPTTAAVNGEPDSYTFDSDNRVTNACYGTSCSAGSQAWTYDDASNVTDSMSAGTSSTATFNSADELTSVTGGATAGARTYDADGRLLTAPGVTYTYNAANELTGLTKGGTTTTYTYNGDGVRTSAVTGGVTTYYAYDMNTPTPQLVTEKVGSAYTMRLDWAGSKLWNVSASGADYLVGHDRQGSVVLLTDSSGAVAKSTKYDPYGNVLHSTSASGTPTIPVGWEAELLDASGLYQQNARYLDSAVDAFTQRDPLSPPVATPQGSPYTYVSGQALQ